METVSPSIIIRMFQMWNRGMDTEQISVITSIPENVVYNNLSNYREKLRIATKEFGKFKK